ncbi:zinc-dependent metalloprotease [Chitinophaga qingshengii]|uniref:Zinc-dependent metalloprotease n=1 Tax=Chitinophaga qingshengii TaxID=1569794 RepID=A0ABR7TMY8_9BACT|nr:zinc-dependent metalloprotease [Chitinophaga qingshengii]MBC9931849.1 zinc-dependent metalloprotease [Chitinophaga qingshengii]
MNRYAYIPCVMVLASCAMFKKNGGKQPLPVQQEVPAGKNGRLPYNKLITTNMHTQRGLFTVHHTAGMDTVLFEIGEPLLGKDILTINRIRKVSGGVKMYAGEQLANNTIFFEKGNNGTLLLRQRYLLNRADSSQAIHRAVTASNTQPVLAVLPILAYGKDSASFVVNMTAVLKDPASFVNDAEGAQINNFLTVKYMKEHEVTGIRVYPANVEITVSKNGMADKTLYSKVPSPASLETNTSFVMLPEKPMQPRYANKLVGYFSDDLIAYSDTQQAVDKRGLINRWRLEPRPADRERYRNGELVEPANPIVLYIDPATPRQWRKYLIQGVNDWQPAFEQAGFKNAITAKEWPENDTSMHMEDVRYSFINYLASEITNAYGPNIHDPRSGEIIQTNIGWYHNIVELLQSWYMIQAGPNDPMARMSRFDEALMGQLIRFVSSHEIGHTLGLRHNFGSSSQTPVDSLRSITYLRQHGHTASIMDYARFNYVAQPEDSIPQELLFPRVNEYDKWAIEWGYRLTDAATPEADSRIMNRLAKDRLAANPRLWYGDGESGSGDPRCQTEDLGDDNAKANTLGIRNLKRVMANLADWTAVEGGFRENLGNAYNAILSQYYNYLNHVANNVGGICYTLRADEDEQPSFVPVDKEKQVAALNYVNQELFTTPEWILDTAILNKCHLPYTMNYIEDMQIKAVNVLLSATKLNTLLSLTKRFGTDKTLTVEETLAKVRGVIWQNLTSPAVHIDAYHRNMQKACIGALFTIIKSGERDVNESDAVTVATAEIKILSGMINKALPAAANSVVTAHLEDLREKIALLSTLL